MNAAENSAPLPGDNPIEDHTKDVLERSGRAYAFAQQVLELDASHGTTVGLFGPWGSGKTSFVNLARKTFEREGALVLDFNPWLFSGAKQLVERFFAELSASMGMKHELKELGEAFGKYGAALNSVAGVASALLALPQIGAIVAKLTDAAVNVSQPESVDALRKVLEGELQKRGKPIVVILDDVDRLSVSEIREVFRLVRLTASFPNLIYIVSCDRLRVEQALGEQAPGLSGRDYLEKIIQWSYNLPEVPSHLLAQQLYKAIEHALAGIENPGPFDEEVWDDLRSDIVRPLIRNMRDVRRYAIAIRETVSGLDGQVALADVLALEAIRLFLPDVFRRLPGAIDGLTGMTRALDRRIDRMKLQFLESPFPRLSKALKAQVGGVIAAAGNELDPDAVRTKEIVGAMVDHLFPVGARLRDMDHDDSDSCVNDNAAEHLSERRVANEHIFRRYLERTATPELLTFHDADRALALMTDRDGLNELIRSLDPTRWQDVVSNLCDLAPRFGPEHVEPGVVVLLNLWPDMPERPSNSSVFGNDTRGTVRRASYRLLSALSDVHAVDDAMRHILPDVTSLSSKVELVLLVGHRENSGHKLVTQIAADGFETALRNEIRAAPIDKLVDEREPSRVLTFAKHYGGPTDEPLDIDASPKLTFTLLRSVRGEMESGSWGSRAVRRTAILNWDRLIDLYGSKEVLKTRINDLKSRFDTLKPWLKARRIPLDEAEQLLDLTDQYLSRSRPDAD